MIYQQQAVGIMFLMNFIISSIPRIYMQHPVKEKSEVSTFSFSESAAILKIW